MFRRSATVNVGAGVRGLCVVDLDGDGFPELVAYGRTLSVWKWTGSTLEDLSPYQLLPANHSPLLETIAADFNGDGRDELLLRCGTKLYLIAHGPTGGLRIGTIPTVLDGPMFAWDRRGTGRYGVASGTRFFELEEQRIVERFDFAPTDRFDRIVAVGPIVSAGRADVLVRMTAGNLGLFVNSGHGRFANLGSEAGLHKFDTDATEVLLVDAGRGDRAGFVLPNADAGHRLLMPQIDGIYRNRASPALAWPTAVSTLIAFDFDHDGSEELLLGHAEEASRLLRLPDGRPLDAGAAGLPMADAVALDLDADGRLELVVLSGESLHVLRPEVIGPMLRVEPRTRLGAPARGCTIHLETDTGRSMTRRLLGRSEPVAHFGFAPDERPTRLILHRPDGSKRVLPLGGETNQLLTIQDAGTTEDIG